MHWGPGELGCWSVASKEPCRAPAGLGRQAGTCAARSGAQPAGRAGGAEELQGKGGHGDAGKMMQLLQWISSRAWEVAKWKRHGFESLGGIILPRLSDSQHNRGQQTSPGAFCGEPSNLQSALANLLGCDFCIFSRVNNAGSSRERGLANVSHSSRSCRKAYSSCQHFGGLESS